jgi:Flp pilus assembly pilin Flp
MESRYTSFLSDESGAITVDWVLLTALLMALTLAVMGTIATGSKNATETMSSNMVSRAMITTF